MNQVFVHCRRYFRFFLAFSFSLQFVFPRVAFAVAGSIEEQAVNELYQILEPGGTLADFLMRLDKKISIPDLAFIRSKVKTPEKISLRPISKSATGYMIAVEKSTLNFAITSSGGELTFKVNNKTILWASAEPIQVLWDRIESALPKEMAQSPVWSLILPSAHAAWGLIVPAMSAVAVAGAVLYREQLKINNCKDLQVQLRLCDQGINSRDVIRMAERVSGMTLAADCENLSTDVRSCLQRQVVRNSMRAEAIPTSIRQYLNVQDLPPKPVNNTSR